MLFRCGRGFRDQQNTKKNVKCENSVGAWFKESTFTSALLYCVLLMAQSQKNFLLQNFCMHTILFACVIITLASCICMSVPFASNLLRIFYANPVPVLTSFLPKGKKGRLMKSPSCLCVYQSPYQLLNQLVDINKFSGDVMPLKVTSTS